MLPSAEENEKQLNNTTGSGEGFLYRYRDLEGKHADWVREIIQESKIYFASSKGFNDPFDCHVRFSSDISKADFKSHAEKLLIERGVPRQKRREILQTPRSIAEFVSNMERGVQDQIDRIGVLSLSATHENILMWSHYAFGHRGVCLQFQISAGSPSFAPALPVRYAPDLPVPNVFFRAEESLDRYMAMLFTKAADWAYEKEWRLANARLGPGHRRFLEHELVGVILGANIAPAHREAVLTWVKSRTAPLTIYQAHQHPRRYALSFSAL